MDQQKQISLEGLKNLLSSKNKNVKVIDIRCAEEYKNQHIPIAENIPAETLDSVSFSQDDTIICVCNHGKQRSQNAAVRLNEKGYENAFYLEGGTAAWFGENSNQIDHP